MLKQTSRQPCAPWRTPGWMRLPKHSRHEDLTRSAMPQRVTRTGRDSPPRRRWFHVFHGESPSRSQQHAPRACLHSELSMSPELRWFTHRGSATRSTSWARRTFRAKECTSCRRRPPSSRTIRAGSRLALCATGRRDTSAMTPRQSSLGATDSGRQVRSRVWRPRLDARSSRRIKCFCGTFSHSSARNSGSPVTVNSLRTNLGGGAAREMKEPPAADDDTRSASYTRKHYEACSSSKRPSRACTPGQRR